MMYNQCIYALQSCIEHYVLKHKHWLYDIDYINKGSYQYEGDIMSMLRTWTRLLFTFPSSHCTVAIIKKTQLII